MTSIVCAPGETHACTCFDGRSGAQVCSADRTGWDACMCTGDAGADASTDVGDVGIGYGLVAVSSDQFTDSTDASVSEHRLIGSFIGVSQPPGCAVTDVPPCQVRQCTIPDGGIASLAVSAGTLTVTGGTTNLSVMQGPSGLYGESANTLLFHGGEPLEIAATGATAPPFTARLIAPTGITVLAPALSASYYLDRATPLSFSWQGMSAGSTEITVSATTSGSAVSILCDVPVADGHFAVSPDALSALPVGPGQISVSSHSFERVTIGGWTIDAHAYSTALDSAHHSFLLDADIH